MFNFSDHAYCLPSYPNFSDCEWFDWLSWPQVHYPISKQAKRYVESLNIEADVAVLKGCGLRPGCIKTLQVGTMLLQKVCYMKILEKVDLIIVGNCCWKNIGRYWKDGM